MHRVTQKWPLVLLSIFPAHQYTLKQSHGSFSL
jgi:hypothetical protein